MQSTRSLRILAFAAAVGLAGLPGPAGAESAPPPTPTGVEAKATGASSDVTFNGESRSLQGTTSSAQAWTTTEARRNGRRGLRVSAVNQPGHVRWGPGAIPQGRRYASVRSWIRLNSRQAGQSVDLITVANGNGSRHFDFFVSAETGRFQWDLLHSRSDRSSFVVTPWRWYLVEALVDFAGSQHTATVRIDGVDQGTITSPGTDTTVRAMTVGAYTAKTHTQDYDDLALDVGYGPMPWIVGDGSSEVEVHWNPVVDVGSGLKEYQIWRNGQWYGYAPAGTTRFVDLAPLEGAYYQLRAVDWHRNRSGWSAPQYAAAAN